MAIAHSSSASQAERAEDLVALVARGDGPALTRFYERTVDGLYAFVFFRVGRDEAAAEDIVQETFIAALDRLSEFDAARGSLRSWVCQLSRNIVRAHLERQRRTEELVMWDRVDQALLAAFERMESEALVDEVLERQETRDLVHLAMGHLPDSHRRVLERKYMDGQTLSELSLELGVSEDAVKSQLARARRAFREAFQTLGRALGEAGT
jgi:RNA polymerase sigma-70 factor (ECF subfamily)